MTYLLDVNILLALSDPAHIHSQPAHAWFQAQPKRLWATCPIIENGFVRILSNQGYSNPVANTAEALEILRDLRTSQGYEFWPDEVSIVDMIGPQVVMSPRRVTDVYLLALAVHNSGKLATLDRRIPVHAVRGGRAAIEFVPT